MAVEVSYYLSQCSQFPPNIRPIAPKVTYESEEHRPVKPMWQKMRPRIHTNRGSTLFDIIEERFDPLKAADVRGAAIRLDHQHRSLG